MAHELEIRNGQASMMYVGDPPWHKLGTPLTQPATALEAIKAAKLDWQVIKLPLVVSHDGAAIPLEDHFAIVRQDLWKTSDYPILGVVGKQYTPLQNEDAFAFFDPIVGHHAAVYHTAGVLGNGERVWILAKLPESIRVIGDDITDKYLLLSNSHDGSSAVQVKFTPIRVVCQNTLTMALRQGPTVRVIHNSSMRDRLAQAEKLLGIVNSRYQQIEKAFQAMVTVQMDKLKLDAYLQTIFPDPLDPEDERAWKRIRSHRTWSEHYFADGRGNNQTGVKGTLWAAYNGVAEYVDYRLTGSGVSDRRLGSAWFGDGYSIKARAYDVAQRRLSDWR